MSRRTEQVAEAIKEDISVLIQRELKDPRVGFVTVTRVEVTPDLKHAKVFFSVIGDSEQRDQSLTVLKHASSFLRHELARQLTLRYVPQLYFQFDEAVEHSDKIHKLLLELEREDQANKQNQPTQVDTESDAPAT